MMRDNTTVRPDNLLEWLFRSRQPCLARFPHTLVRADQTTLRVLSDCTGTRLGLWGERPMFRSDGTHYLEPQNSKIEDDFALWNLELNQQYLHERATVGPDPKFFMFISADTPTHVLSTTYEHFDEEKGDSAPWFEDYINYVCDWLEALRWVLIPLEGEMGWSIFAAAKDQIPLVEKVRAEFLKAHTPVAQLVANGDRWLWTGSPAVEGADWSQETLQL